jgi:hypothetical protein
MTAHTPRSAFHAPAIALLFLAAAGCSERTQPSSGLEITVSALTLPNVADVCYSLTIRNEANQTVSSRSDICGSNFGINGDITYIATCDATDSDGNGLATHTVSLTVDGLYGGPGKTQPLTDFINPCAAPHAPQGCQLTANCVENADTPITFNLTLMREANQGFFDIGVQFDDIFCSAKLDCLDGSGSPLTLLHHPTSGLRGQTAVVALACTSGPGAAPTHLLRDPIKVTCGATTTWLDPAHGKGNAYTAITPDPDPTDAIWQYATYAGSELLDCGGTSCDKRYWNIALGFTPTAPNCRLQTTATAIDGAATYSTPDATNYPIITWDVALTTGSPGTLACTSHPLNGSPTGVATVYSGLGTSKTFVDRFDGTSLSHGPCPAGFSGPTCSTSSSVPSISVTNGLVLSLDAGQAASYPGSGTTWLDLTANNYDGTLFGGPATSSSSGLVFGGSDDYYTLPTPISQTMNTISVWVRMQSTGMTPIVVYGDDTFQSTAWSWGMAVFPGDTMGFNESPRSYPTTELYTEAVPIDTWVNYTLVRNDGGNAKVYKDGVLVGTRLNTGSTAIHSASNRLRIAKTGSQIGTFDLATLHIYDRALSAAEVLQNFNGMKSRFIVPPSCDPACGLHGTCTGTNKCTCEDGWYGATCESEVSNVPVTSGLLLELDAGLSESYPGAGSTWFDLAGSNYNVALVSGVAYSAANQGHLIFDGSDDYATLSSAISQAVNTVSIWVKMGSTAAQPIVVYGSDAFQSTNWSWGLAVYPTNTIGMNEGPLSYPTTSLFTEAVAVGTWRNYTLVRNDGGSAKVYKNGVLVGTKSGAGTTAVQNSAHRLRIAKTGGQIGNFSLATVHLYDRALSSAEVLQNFNALKGRFGLP